MDRESNTWSVITALLIGGVIGAGVMILFAPQSGHETRGLLRDKSRDIRDRAVKTAEKTSNQTGKVVGELTQRAKDRATSLLQRGREMTEEYKSNIEGEAKSKSVQFR
ncbi:MAG TPA: YtxH domain-containing protein [Anaerolineaceae bacterium]|nr:YtxH domain-containing protein [Anaerolineaceae bacterium]